MDPTGANEERHDGVGTEETNGTVTVTADCTDESSEKNKGQGAGTEETDGTDTVTDDFTDDPTEKSGTLEFDINQISTEATNKNLNGSNSEDKNQSPETEDVRTKDSPTESNVINEHEDYDVEKVIRKQKSHRLICPHCKKKITKTVILVRRRRRNIHGGHGSKKPPESKTPVSETTEIDSASDDDDPLPVPDADKDSDNTSPDDEIKTSPLDSKDEDEKEDEDDEIKTLPVDSKDEYGKEDEGKQKEEPNQDSTSIDKKLKTLVRDFRLWFFSVPPLWFLLIGALLFLLMNTLWFLSTSPPHQFPSIPLDKLSSTSSPWLLSTFVLFLLTALALLFHFSPDHTDKTDGKNTSSDPNKVIAESKNQLNEENIEKQSAFSEDDQSKDKQPSKEESKPETEPTPVISKTTKDLNIKDKIKTEDLPTVIPEKGRKFEILRSIVYGGLIESITSLGIVSSGAGSGASTLNIFVIGLANLGSGIMLIVNNLLELKAEEPKRKGEDRYEQLIGRRENFRLHIVIVISSFIVFGVIPPLVYGISFPKSEQRRYKVGTVLVVSLACVISLAIAKAHVSKTRHYLKTLLRYTKLAIGASGISYIVGGFVNDLLERYGFYDESSELRRG